MVPDATTPAPPSVPQTDPKGLEAGVSLRRCIEPKVPAPGILLSPRQAVLWPMLRYIEVALFLCLEQFLSHVRVPPRDILKERNEISFARMDWC